MVILVDTSIWVDHIRKNNEHLDSLLEEGVIALHPFVLGELACGNLDKRETVLSLLQTLPPAALVESTELLHFIKEQKLAGSGIGFIDAHLLASAQLIQAFLWTKDKALQKAASKLDLSYT